MWELDCAELGSSQPSSSPAHWRKKKWWAREKIRISWHREKWSRNTTALQCIINPLSTTSSSEFPWKADVNTVDQSHTLCYQPEGWMWWFDCSGLVMCNNEVTVLHANVHRWLDDMSWTAYWRTLIPWAKACVLPIVCLFVCVCD